MNNRILLVDDEANLLQAFRRNLRGRFEVVIAEGGRAGIEQLDRHGPFAIVVSDMQMPDVNGIQVLSAAKRLAPDTVRIMLTGNVDQQTAVEAVNNGSIFRFITKPCPIEQLSIVLDEGLRNYQVAIAEKELLSKTLAGCVNLINELLAVANPKGFGRGGRMRQWMKRLCDKLFVPDIWQYEVAAMLSQVGSIGTCLLDTHSPPKSLAEQQEALRSQAIASEAMLSKIPRLEMIAAMIGNQYASPQAEGIPFEAEMGGKLLRILSAFDILCESMPTNQAVQAMKEDSKAYDAEALDAFANLVLGNHTVKSLPIANLLEGMVLVDNVLTNSGDILLSKGHELTSSMIQRLKSFVRNSIPVVEPIVVRVHAA